MAKSHYFTYEIISTNKMLVPSVVRIFKGNNRISVRKNVKATTLSSRLNWSAKICKAELKKKDQKDVLTLATCARADGFSKAALQRW